MHKRIALVLAGATLGAFTGICHAYGEEGHTIVAEIAQRRLEPAARTAVARLLHGGSLASIADWADNPDFGESLRRPGYNSQISDVAAFQGAYERQKECADSPTGDCIAKELEGLRLQLLAAPSSDQRRDALMLAVHFVGDVHKPLNSNIGNAGIWSQPVKAAIFHGSMCGSAGCVIGSSSDGAVSLRLVLETGLIKANHATWGEYVDALEVGILKTDSDLRQLGHLVEPRQWAAEGQQVAKQFLPPRATELSARTAAYAIDDAYYDKVTPLLDRRLAIAGLRLAAFLNQVYSDSPSVDRKDYAPAASQGFPTRSCATAGWRSPGCETLHF